MRRPRVPNTCAKCRKPVPPSRYGDHARLCEACVALADKAYTDGMARERAESLARQAAESVPAVGDRVRIRDGYGAGHEFVVSKIILDMGGPIVVGKDERADGVGGWAVRASGVEVVAKAAAAAPESPKAPTPVPAPKASGKRLRGGGKRLLEIVLPDGKVATRTTAHAYTHVIAVLVDEGWYVRTWTKNPARALAEAKRSAVRYREILALALPPIVYASR